MSMPWIKLYTEILDDPKLGRLDDAVKWRFVQLCLMAGECGAEGYLVNGHTPLSLHDIAWRLRQNPASMGATMEVLTNAGFVKVDSVKEEQRWYISDFQEWKPPHQGEQWEQLWHRAIMQRDRWICRYCGAPAEHVDHVIPRCQGGKDDLDNLVAACADCNLSKGGRTPEQAGMVLRDA